LILAEFSADVILGSFISGASKDLIRGPLFYELSAQKKTNSIGHAGSLLDVVGDEDDRVFFLEFGE
jgi:hypothetical protein